METEIPPAPGAVTSLDRIEVNADAAGAARVVELEIYDPAWRAAQEERTLAERLPILQRLGEIESAVMESAPWQTLTGAVTKAQTKLDEAKGLVAQTKKDRAAAKQSIRYREEQIKEIQTKLDTKDHEPGQRTQLRETQKQYRQEIKAQKQQLKDLETQVEQARGIAQQKSDLLPSRRGTPEANGDRGGDETARTTGDDQAS